MLMNCYAVQIWHHFYTLSLRQNGRHYYLKILNLQNACQIYFVKCVSKIKHILSVIRCTLYGAVCFQFTYVLFNYFSGRTCVIEFHFIKSLQLIWKPDTQCSYALQWLDKDIAYNEKSVCRCALAHSISRASGKIPWFISSCKIH